MLKLTYAQARTKIHDGDLISVFKAHSIFNVATQLFTGEYTHTGIAIWMDGILWVVETNGGGNHAIPLSQLEKFGFDVSSPPEGVTRMAARASAIRALRNRDKYGFMTTLVTGFIEFFNIPIKINWRNGRHCAGLCVRIYDMAGWANADGGTHSYVVSPTKLTKQMFTRFRVLPSKTKPL